MADVIAKSSNTNSSINSTLIDESVLEEFRQYMGEETDDMVEELLELYLKNTPALLTLIGEDIRVNNMSTLKIHLHSLKGSSAQLGVVGISDHCRKIENVIQEENFDQLLPLFEQLLLTYQQVEKIFINRLKAK
jgi:HPt (histidine-containing phosphotransfer) domain-containing protein